MDLNINVGSLPKEGSTIDLDIKKADVSVNEIVSDVHVYAWIHKSGNSYNIKGFEEYTLTLKCSRCLANIEHHEKRNFNLEFKKDTNYTIDSNRSRETDETESEYIVENDCINLGPFLRDEIILSIPMKPLCREECMGLCPICGINLNKKTCLHSKEKEKSLT
jgi:uncharacterized protein